MKTTLCILLLIFTSRLLNAQWIEQSAGYPQYLWINQVIAINDSVAWGTPMGSGSYNSCIRTIDKGNTWEIKSINGTSNNVEWIGLTAINSQTAWAMLSTNNGYDLDGIFKTTDGGNNWIKLNTDGMYLSSTSEALIIYFWNADHGVVIGSPAYGHFEIYLTDDGGLTWAPVNPDYLPDPLPAEDAYPLMFAVGNGTLWFSSNKARAYKTMDMGYSWTVYNTGLNTPNSYQPIAAKDENTCWMADKFYLKRTDDGGSTWNYVSVSGPKYRFFTYVPQTAETLVSVEGGNNTFPDGSSFSLDGGSTWVGISYEVAHYCVSFINNHTGWSGSDNHSQSDDGLYKFGGSFIATECETPKQKISGIEIIPNPGTGNFHVTCNFLNALPATLSIFDLNGRQLFTGMCNLETSDMFLDMKDYPKGIYLLSVVNGSELLNKKLVIR